MTIELFLLNTKSALLSAETFLLAQNPYILIGAFLLLSIIALTLYIISAPAKKTTQEESINLLESKILKSVRYQRNTWMKRLSRLINKNKDNTPKEKVEYLDENNELCAKGIAQRARLTLIVTSCTLQSDDPSTTFMQDYPEAEKYLEELNELLKLNQAEDTPSPSDMEEKIKPAAFVPPLIPSVMTPPSDAPSQDQLPKV